MEYAPDNESPTQHPEAIQIEPIPSDPRQPSLSYNPPPNVLKSSPQSPSKENFVSQLSEKIRQQARQLQEQENYKILCEKRILELCPNHPLPVQSIHLGKIMGPSAGAPLQMQPLLSQIADLKKMIEKKDQELHFITQRADKLQLELEKSKHYTPKKDASPEKALPDMPLVSKITELQKEKQQVEESLRAEILNNEEQRNYIQILKEALEARIEDLGFSEIFNKARELRPNVQIPDLFAEMANLKKSADFHRKELVKFESASNQLQTEVDEYKKRISDLEQENSELNKKMQNSEEDVHNAIKALEESRDQVEKLEQEKNQLLDYVEEITQKNDQMTANLESLNILHKKISEEKLLCDKHIESLEKELKNGPQKQELEKRDKKLEEYRVLVEKYAQQITQLKEKCEEKAKAISEMMSKLEMDRELNETKEKELKEALNSLQDIKNESMTQAFKIKEQLEATMGSDKKVLEEQITNLREENNSMQEKIKELTEMNKILVEDKKKIQDNYTAINNTVNELQTEIENMRINTQNMENQQKQLQSELNETRKKKEEHEKVIIKLGGNPMEGKMPAPSREINMLKDELQSVKDELQKAKSEINIHKKEATLKGDEIKIYAAERDQYKKELENMKLQGREVKEELQKTSKVKKESDKSLEELQNKLNQTKNELNEKTIELNILKTDLNKSKNDLEKYMKDAENLHKQLIQVYFFTISL